MLRKDKKQYFIESVDESFIIFTIFAVFVVFFKIISPWSNFLTITYLTISIYENISI